MIVILGNSQQTCQSTNIWKVQWLSSQFFCWAWINFSWRQSPCAVIDSLCAQQGREFLMWGSETWTSVHCCESVVPEKPRFSWRMIEGNLDYFPDRKTARCAKKLVSFLWRNCTDSCEPPIIVRLELILMWKIERQLRMNKSPLFVLVEKRAKIAEGSASLGVRRRQSRVCRFVPSSTHSDNEQKQTNLFWKMLRWEAWLPGSRPKGEKHTTFRLPSQVEWAHLFLWGF